jgi:hypothetical protein
LLDHLEELAFLDHPIQGQLSEEKYLPNI